MLCARKRTGNTNDKSIECSSDTAHHADDYKNEDVTQDGRDNANGHINAEATDTNSLDVAVV